MIVFLIILHLLLSAVAYFMFLYGEKNLDYYLDKFEMIAPSLLVPVISIIFIGVDIIFKKVVK